VTASSRGVLTAPFVATVKPHSMRVRLRSDSKSPEVGLLREGAAVTVTACEPDCETPLAWALLGTDGVVRLDALTAQHNLVEPPVAMAAESLWYGRVGPSGIMIFREPNLHGPVLTRKRLSREMAFFPRVELRSRGWLERVEGGFVRVRRVAMLTPSLFHGEPTPHLPLAFVLRDLRPLGAADGIRLPRRYDRLAVLEADATRIVTPLGPLPRNAVRVVALQRPPRSIPVGAKWVLIDLAQQTLTAYEGELPVYATLISSGKGHDETETHAGLYRVEHKMAYSDMHGETDDPYDVDRVPYTLYFHKNEALHGTYWHDGFGARASHGCVNLSLADARWLFNWAPPKLPENWSAIDPENAGLTSLWVLVEEQATLSYAPQISLALPR
jgi:L,D-transpeptidase-like protein